MLFSPIEDAPQKHYFFVVRSSQDHQYSFIRTPRTNVSEAALSVQMFIGIGITYENAQQYQQREEHFQQLIKEQGQLRLLNDIKPSDFRKTVNSIDAESLH